MNSLAADLATQVMVLYRRLEGRGESPKLRPGGWDLAFDSNLLVELDEELHFNRYRLMTLDPGWAESLPWRNDYIGYCDDREVDCLSAGTWGQRWSNSSCEAMFGPADPPGILRSRGAPRWKQRALYDAVKDAFALSSTEMRLARLAVYDRVGGIEIGAVLDGQATLDTDALMALLQHRTVTVGPSEVA